MKKIAVVFCVVFSFAAILSAQNRTAARRTITNSDLQRFEQQRVAAERDYRATYAQRGMPSPEEVAKINEKRANDLQELAAKLHWADLERERLRAEIELRRYPSPTIVNVPPAVYGAGGVVYSYGGWDGFFGHHFGNRFRNRWYPGLFGQGYYAAGGNVWPAPVGAGQRFPTPLFRIQPRISPPRPRR